jgi:tetratricopeptide (TPR) repeat protein
MGIPEKNIQDPLIAYEHYAQKGEWDEAAAVASSVLTENFHDGRAVCALANAYREAERFGHAFALYERGASLLPNNSDPWIGMGYCLTEVWRLDEAERCFRKALKINPSDFHAVGNLGLIALYKCQPDEALKWISRALTLNPDSPGAIQNRAYAKLMKQDWSGWEDWQHILGRVKSRSERVYEGNDGNIPRWNGEKGKTVLVYGEQGLGDEISFASCLPDLIRDSERVLVDCDKRLEGLFARSFTDAEIHGTRFGTPDWVEHADYRVAIGDLPRFYRTKSEDFPGTPYLVADPERRLQWRALLDSYKRPAIGIAWTGGTEANNKKARSLPLSAFKPILDSVNATWVSLEYKDKSAEATQFGLKDWERGTRTKDYDDTAALVAELDLVISVTTAVVHLAGALGKAAWVLVPNRPRWWYSLEGERSPWYSSVRFFRQLGSVWPVGDIVSELKRRYG